MPILKTSNIYLDLDLELIKIRSPCCEMTNPHTWVTVKLLGLPPFTSEQEHSAEECLNVDWKRNCPQTFTQPLPQIKTGNLVQSNLMAWGVGGELDLSATTVSAQQVAYRGTMYIYFRNYTKVQFVNRLDRSTTKPYSIQMLWYWETVKCLV